MGAISWVLSIFWAAAAEAADTVAKIPSVQVERIDATPLGMVVGGLVTGGAVAGLFIVAGWFMVKYGVVRFGAAPVTLHDEVLPHLVCPENCPACAAEKQRSLNNEKLIAELFQKYNEGVAARQDIAINLATITTNISNIKDGIDELKGRRRGTQADA